MKYLKSKTNLMCNKSKVIIDYLLSEALLHQFFNEVPSDNVTTSVVLIYACTMDWTKSFRRLAFNQSR